MGINKMRRFTAAALAFALTFTVAPLFAARAPLGGQAPALGSIAGSATTSAGQTVANATVQLRNLVTGQLAGTTTSTATGTFTFAGVQAGSYAVEVVSAAGQIVGTSASIAVASGATITSVAVTTTAALTGAAAGGAAAAGAAGAGAAAGVSTAVIVTTVAAVGGIVGAVAVATNNASPSR
jgi:hypothetical protein